MKKRESRRDRSWRAARRQQALHLQIHRGGAVDCICELSVWYFEKRRGLGCDDCRKKRHGQPKLGSGLKENDPAAKPVGKRRQWRAERFRWMRWNGDGDDFECAPDR